MASEAVACPSCGARNRSKWEFCARCGESLAAATSGAPPKVARPAAAATARPSSLPGILLGAVVVVGGVLLAYRLIPRGEPTPGAGPLLLAASEAPRGPVVSSEDAGAGLYREGQRLIGAGQREAALEQFKRALEAVPSNPSYHLATADVLEKLGRTSEGLDAYRAAAQLAPRHNADLARALERSGDPDGAERSYQLAVQAEPDNAELAMAAAELLSRLDRMGDAVPYYERAASLKPRDGFALKGLAEALAAKGDTPRAEKAYRAYLTQLPGDPLTRARYAEMLAGANRLDDAILTTREGVAANASAPLLHKTLGSLLERAGKYAEAAAAYRDYLTGAPTAADAQAIQGRVDALAAAVASAEAPQ